MNRRALLTAISGGTIAGLSGCLTSSGTTPEYDRAAYQSVVPVDDECVGDASLSDLVAWRYGDESVSGPECPKVALENYRDEAITADVQIDRQALHVESDESFSGEIPLDPRTGIMFGRVFEPSEEVDVSVTVGDEQFDGRWNGPPCYEHALAITDDGVEFETRQPCKPPLRIRNERSESITATVVVDSEWPQYHPSAPYDVDAALDQFERTFDIDPGESEFEDQAFRLADDLEVMVTVGDERFEDRWTRGSCLAHTLAVEEDGIETGVEAGCPVPFAIENERDTPITASVAVDSFRPEPAAPGPAYEPERFEEVFDLDPGERALEMDAFEATVDLDVTVTVDGEVLEGRLADPSCYVCAVAVTDEGLEVGEVPTLYGDADFSHGCVPGDETALHLSSERGSWTVEVTIDDRCTEQSTTETIEVDPDGRFVPGLRAGSIQEVTIDVHGGETVSREFGTTCRTFWVTVTADGSVRARPTTII